MRRGDDFKKLDNNDSLQSIFVSSIAAFRMKTLINLILHLVFAALYAFEHNNQVILYSDAINVENGGVVTAPVSSTTEVEVVYTPVGNIIVMVLNLILALLIAQITVNIDN